jgi:hypothetical protein
VQAAKAAPSRRQSKDTPARVSENENVADASAVDVGGVESRLGAGGGETVHEYWAVALVPSAFVARTRNV